MDVRVRLSTKKLMLSNSGAREDSRESPGQQGYQAKSILKEMNLKHSLEGLMLKLQYFGHLMQRADSLEKTLMLEKIKGQRRRGQQRMRWLDGITDSMDIGQPPGDGEGQGTLVCCSP